MGTQLGYDPLHLPSVAFRVTEFSHPYMHSNRNLIVSPENETPKVYDYRYTWRTLKTSQQFSEEYDALG